MTFYNNNFIKNSKSTGLKLLRAKLKKKEGKTKISSNCSIIKLTNKYSKMRLEIVELRNRVTKLSYANDVVLRVTNSKMFTEILLSS